MYGNNVFVVITQYDRRALDNSVLELAENCRWFRPMPPPWHSRPSPLDDLEPPIEDDDGNDDPLPLPIGSLVVSLDDYLSNPEKGIQLGTDPAASDVLLNHPWTSCGVIGDKQWALTVDDDLRVWLHRYELVTANWEGGEGSMVGGGGGGWGSDERTVVQSRSWAVADRSGVLYNKISITSSELALRLEFPNHRRDPMDPGYLAHLRAFVARSRPGAEEAAHAQRDTTLGLAGLTI